MWTIEQHIFFDKITFFILPENDLLENATALKTFEYSRLGSELKKQTSFSEKQYQGLNKLLRSDEEEEWVTIKKKEN